MWHPLGQDPGVGSRVVLGIAPYSLPDLELVDTLMDALSEDRPKYGELVQLFDIMACTNMRDFEDRIPGIGEVFQTPVVGIWEGGALVGKGTGAKARQLIAERFRLRD